MMQQRIRRCRIRLTPIGDGKASERILQALRHEFLGDANRPNRFGK